MSSSSAQVFEAALALSADERGKLAEKLVQSLDEEVEPEAAQAWGTEIERRLARHDAGEGKTLTMEESLARLHRAARGR
jgi:putative addiction module component (TIGR02574 family)